MTRAVGARARVSADPGRGRAVRSALLAAVVLVAVLLGSMLREHATVAFGVVFLVAALPLVNARPVTWIILAIAVTWTSRLVTTTGLAPRFLDFMDFPLVLIAFVASAVSHLASGRLLPVRQRTVGRRLALVATVIALSWSFSSLDEPQRLIAGLVFALEPFLLLMAVFLAPMTQREHKALLITTVILLCGQMPVSLVQIASGGVADAVKGTLLEAGAGHHVSAGGVTLGFFLLAALRAPKLLLGVYGGLALLILVVSDSKQVLFALPLALLVLGLTAGDQRSAVAMLRGLVAGVLLAAASVYALLTYQASATAFDFIERSSTNKTGKVAVAEALWHDVTSSAPTAVLGLGPGESVSRFAFLTTPGLLKAGSPVALLGLEASTGAEKYDDIAFGGSYTGMSSFTSAQSSAFGVFGDYGVAGVLAFSALIVSILRAVAGGGRTDLRAAALSSWALLLPLAVIFDWLEQPPFTLAIMVITGLAGRRADTLSPSRPAQGGQPLPGPSTTQPRTECVTGTPSGVVASRLPRARQAGASAVTRCAGSEETEVQSHTRRSRGEVPR